MFSRKGAVKKCSSISWAPLRNSAMTADEYWRERGRMPTAEQTEKRPPTQSQNPKMLEGEMPNAVALGIAVLTAQKCFAMAAPSSLTPFAARPFNSQFLAVRAFSMVSAVVKVLLIITQRVVSGSRSPQQMSKSTGSTLAKNFRVLPEAATLALASALSASFTNSGPSCDPPIPMHTKLVSGLPVTPTCSPLRTFWTKASIFSRTL
mmetsp:Transcript_30056/g.30416  ORF Transcript_30056/g.30416 Transcript_30056/m.30416 type:complete len:206 (-) Transcript_30056:8-625(-)